MKETAFAEALAQEDWDTAARYLLVGFARALEKLPADSIEGLLDTMIGKKDAPPTRRRKAAQNSR